MRNIVRILRLCVLSLSLNACSGVLPVPGGKNTINNEFYQSDAELKQKLSFLKEGMSIKKVFWILERRPDELKKLNRLEIIEALYGGASSPYTTGAAINPYKEINIKSLSGYRLNYGVIKRKHGVRSPISLRTNETGFEYSAVIIFKDDILFEEPFLSGGLIDNSSSKTIFDYFNPGLVVGRF